MQSTASVESAEMLEVLVDERLAISWQCVLTDQKENSILGCTERSMTSRLGRSFSTSAPHDTPHGVLHPALGSQHKDLQ